MRLPACPDEKRPYRVQLDIFLDPHDPRVIEQARRDGVLPEAWLIAARNSPVYKMGLPIWKRGPCCTEYRTPLHGLVCAAADQRRRQRRLSW